MISLAILVDGVASTKILFTCTQIQSSRYVILDILSSVILKIHIDYT